MAYTLQAQKKMNRAMRMSVIFGCLMLFIKTYAYFLTCSMAVLSDSAESIVHLFAVGFAAYSMWLSHKPADCNHTYGHDRIIFFSAGFEGAMIIIAACFIFYQAIDKLLYGFELENLDRGIFFIALATLLNGGLGFYLIQQGKRYHSLVLEADGKHVLTDCLTSLGVIVALVLTALTHWSYFDPLIALLIGCNILWTGARLLHNAFHGLMDRSDPLIDKRIHLVLEEATKKYPFHYHQVRHRNAGNRLLIELHLLFPQALSIAEAHEVATYVESHLEAEFEKPVEVTTHLEPLESHDEVHNRLLGHKG